MNNLDKSVDHKLSEIETLRWLPWIGDNYFSIAPQERLVIVGESHYYTSGDGGKEEDTYYSEYTRNIVSESLIRGDWSTRTLTNLSSLLGLSTPEERETFWRQSVYFNFVQSSMDYTHKERPSDEHNEAAWANFLKLHGILQARYYLFIGVEAFNSFTVQMEAHSVKSSCDWREKISGTYLREATLLDSGTSLIGIKHLGTINSWPAWQKVLAERYIPNIQNA